MIDREKVIKALKCCAGTNEGKTCIYIATANNCPYEDLLGEYEGAYYECTTALATDALELLKEQEPVKPDYMPTTLEWSCGNCGQSFDRCKYKYCPYCGRKVKWDE